MLASSKIYPQTDVLETAGLKDLAILARERLESTQSSNLDDNELADSKTEERKFTGKAGSASYAAMRIELKSRIVKEVMKEVMPDIGSYEIDGVVTANPKVRKGKIVNVLKFLGLWPLTAHEIVLTGSFLMLDKFIDKINSGKTPTPMLINQYDEKGTTPLSIAVKLKRDDMVTLLLDSKALADICDEHTGRTPLMFSIMNGTHYISKLLLDKGASVNMVDFECISPLMLATERGDLRHTEMLCSRLAEVDAQDINGWTALHYGAHNNAHRCCVMLLEYGAHRDIRDAKKRKALHIAKFLNHGECVSVLEDLKSRIAAMELEDL